MSTCNSEYEDNRDAIEASLRIGIETEREDPHLAPTVDALTDKQVRWIAAWLAGEDFGRVDKDQS